MVSKIHHLLFMLLNDLWVNLLSLFFCFLSNLDKLHHFILHLFPYLVNGLLSLFILRCHMTSIVFVFSLFSSLMHFLSHFYFWSTFLKFSLLCALSSLSRLYYLVLSSSILIRMNFFPMTIWLIKKNNYLFIISMHFIIIFVNVQAIYFKLLKFILKVFFTKGLVRVFEEG